MEIATKKTKVFGFVGKYHLRTKIIVNDERLEQVSQFTYLGCGISYWTRGKGAWLPPNCAQVDMSGWDTKSSRSRILSRVGRMLPPAYF